MSSWYQEAFTIIKQQEYEHPELSREDLHKYCSKHYPFAARKGWAYKAWLSAMHDIFGKKKRKATGESDLFEDKK